VAPLVSSATGPPSAAVGRTTPPLLDHRQRRHDRVRRGVIVVVTVALAMLVIAVTFPVASHFSAAWWLEGLSGAVLWEIDETNWRQGGATTVELAAIRRSNHHFNDADLTHVRKLHRVVSLNLAENDQITNRGLAALRGIDSLKVLNLERMDRYRNPQSMRVSIPLTDACLIHVQALPRLEVLTLAGNLITDQGLAQIATMRNLKTIDLEATEITDAGLAYIEGMKRLESVNLAANRVTKPALTQLQMARPDLFIELDTEPAVEERVKLTRSNTP
jgi:Leucine Rich repeat